MTQIEKLLKEASDLAGRSVEVVSTKDGRYIVMFLSMEDLPPPKGDTAHEALEGFIQYMKNRKSLDLPEVTDA